MPARPLSLPSSSAPRRAFAHTVLACAASLALHAVAFGALSWIYGSAGDDPESLEPGRVSVYFMPAAEAMPPAMRAAPGAQPAPRQIAEVPASPIALPDASTLPQPRLESRLEIPDVAPVTRPVPLALASLPVVAAARPSRRPGPRGNTGQNAALEWRVQEWLAQHRSYPRAARRAGYQGIVWVRFVLARDGGLRGSELMRSSGHALLDRAALDLLQRASPFPALPGDLALEEIELVLPIQYDLTGVRGG